MKKKMKIRGIIQSFFFILIAFITINKTLVESGRGFKFLSSASLHAICPFGGVVSIYELLTAGTLVKKIHESSFVLMIIVFLIAVAFGAIFCGWICPFGSIQEWVSKVGKKIFKGKHNNFIPSKIDKYLRFLRYLVLVWVVYVTAVTGKIGFSDVDPYYSLFKFWTGEVAITGIVILIVILAASLFMERPWCKYLCPYGAVLGVFNLFRIFKIKRNPKTCISCTACDKVCPMNIKVSETKVVRNHQCISCMKCTSEEGCKVEDTVNFTCERRTL
ncbi:4Fe-4S binding protein [Oceanirhabdus sp. W0125-5]|uniref:4Fe-4S binding protein n=1 Tax=Oceanirhabdus sp. W0125-5 TaxID=2999116 RepID=UPI0022F322AE|nr:4Fe-4S binding protein [Oceanirhabdus sp. W0125-5]WBW99565.1 4Fe-4S binding protein [Oceanirhabdus sp. W0125-5]